MLISFHFSCLVVALASQSVLSFGTPVKAGTLPYLLLEAAVDCS